MKNVSSKMSDDWLEENVRPLSHEDSDRLLIEDLEPVVNKLKEKGAVSWHFLRESENWRGHQRIRHIRLRFKTKILEHLKKLRSY